jgi:hypothetical protein
LQGDRLYTQKADRGSPNGRLTPILFGHDDARATAGGVRTPFRFPSEEGPPLSGLFASWTRSKVPFVAAFPDLLRTDRERRGFTVGQVAWRLGIKSKEYRELEAGTRSPDFETWDRICKLYGWPQTWR